MKSFFFVVVLFTTPENPAPHTKDEWEPRSVETIDECHKRAQAIHHYIRTNYEGWHPLALCLEDVREPVGEAL